MTSCTMPVSSPSTAYAEGEPQRLTGRAWTRSTSNVSDCGPATPSGSTSLHHALPPSLPVGLTRTVHDTTFNMSTIASSSSSTSSSPHRHRQVAICHSSPHHSHYHHRFMCSNHALSCCSNHALSGCSELQPFFVLLQLTSKVNVR